MAIVKNCRPKFKSGALGKLETDAVAWFTRVRKAEDCNVFGFRRSTASFANVLFSNTYHDKADPNLCGLDKCDMSGTLFVTPTVNADATGAQTAIVAPIQTTGEAFQYGYLRVLVYANANDSFQFTVNNPGDKVNANSYDFTATKTGWNIALLELFNPDNVLGSGWIGNEDGIELKTSPSQQTPFRLSTIELFANAYDLIRDETFGISCISDFSGDPELTLTEDLCDVPTFDKSATTIERTLTGSNFIGETASFGGLTRRTDVSEAPVLRNGTFTPHIETINGKDFAVLTLPDLAQIKCAYFMVQPQNCEYESLMHMNIDGVASIINMPESMYYRDGNKLYLSKSYLDEKVVVAYPVMEDVTTYEITTEELDQNIYHMEMSLPVKGEEYILQADRVGITGIPWTWTNEAGTFEVAYSMLKDDQGKFGQFLKVNNNK